MHPLSLDAGKPGMKNGKFTARFMAGSEDRVIQEKDPTRW